MQSMRYIFMMGLALMLSAGVSSALADQQGEQQQKQKQKPQGQQQEDVQGQPRHGMTEEGQQEQQRYQQPGQQQEHKQQQVGKLGQQGEKQRGQGYVLLPKETITELQSILKDRGFYDGNVDGIVGPKTINGLRQFQNQSNIDATARLDDETVRQLGLNLPGSEMRPVRGESPEQEGQEQRPEEQRQFPSDTEREQVPEQQQVPSEGEQRQEQIPESPEDTEEGY